MNTDNEIELLKNSINHILDSGANDIRLIECFERFAKPYKDALKEIIEVKSMATSTEELFPVLQLINKAKKLFHEYRR